MSALWGGGMRRREEVRGGYGEAGGVGHGKARQTDRRDLGGIIRDLAIGERHRMQRAPQD